MSSAGPPGARPAHREVEKGPSRGDGPGAGRAKSAAGNRTFLAGAKGRLLPASVPFRYFGAAVVYHVLAWVALLPRYFAVKVCRPTGGANSVKVAMPLISSAVPSTVWPARNCTVPVGVTLAFDGWT